MPHPERVFRTGAVLLASGGERRRESVDAALPERARLGRVTPGRQAKRVSGGTDGNGGASPRSPPDDRDRRYSTFAFARRSVTLRENACSCRRSVSCGLISSKLGNFACAHVLDQDHVPAELRLHRHLGVLALLELDHRVAERLHVAGGRVPVEIAAAVLRAGVLRLLRRAPRTCRPFLSSAMTAFASSSFSTQDVACLVLLVAARAAQLLVLRLELRVGDRVRLDEVGDVGVPQHLLARELELGLDVGVLREPFLAWPPGR